MSPQKTSEAPYQKGPARHAVALQPPGATILIDSPVSTRDHRQRQVHRLAVTAQVLAAYGLAADIGTLPPGPDVCGPSCPWCERHLEVVSA